jgi:hypothetical protein
MALLKGQLCSWLLCWPGGWCRNQASLCVCTDGGGCGNGFQAAGGTCTGVRLVSQCPTGAAGHTEGQVINVWWLLLSIDLFGAACRYSHIAWGANAFVLVLLLAAVATAAAARQLLVLLHITQSATRWQCMPACCISLHPTYLCMPLWYGACQHTHGETFAPGAWWQGWQRWVLLRVEGGVAICWQQTGCMLVGQERAKAGRWGETMWECGGLEALIVVC